MNIYIEGSKVLEQIGFKKRSLKTAVYNSTYENKKQLLALICETLKFSDILEKAVKSLQLLQKERLLKNDIQVAKLLLYDYMIGKGLYKPGRLKQTMTRNKADINAYFEKLLIDHGVQSIREIKTESRGGGDPIPRYVRVNLLKTSVEGVIEHLKEEGWEQVDDAKDCDSFFHAVENLEDYQFLRDYHLPDVLVLPPHTDFHDNQLLSRREIILQDKASCFPAHVLNPPQGAVIIDCCAAPGNKTSHLASLINNEGKIIAVDKSGMRLATLQKLTAEAGLTCVQTVCTDFLRVSPNQEPFCNAKYMILDPSCSGSGIVSRMNEVTDSEESSSQERLKNLANFQAMILKHALTFPYLKKLVYSTCSIHPEENEQVVEEIYATVKDRFKLKKVRPDWTFRGQEGYAHAQRFIRLSPETAKTNGFFIACFKKRKHPKNSEENCDLLPISDGNENTEHCEEIEFVKVKKAKRKRKRNDSD